MPWVIRKRDDQWCVYKEGQDGEASGDSLGCHGSKAEAESQVKALYADVEESTAGAAGFDYIAETTEGTFKGGYPQVPTAEGVDLSAIEAMDNDPLFITLPVVPEVGTVSKNGLLYDDALLAEIERQIQTKRPGANFGHVAQEDRSTAFPKPEALWVGAKREGNTLWGKAYVRPGAARDYIKTLKAVGGTIATSIYGSGRYEQVRKGVKRLADFELDTLDFAPPARAALGVGSTPVLTTEMAQDTIEDDTMNKAEFIAELTVDDIPENIRDAIIAENDKLEDTANHVAELEQQVEDRDAQIAELTSAVAEFRALEFARQLDSKIAELANWQVSSDEAQAKLDAFQRTLRSQIIAELAGETDEDKVSEAVSKVWDDLKPLAETIRDALAGPPAIVGGKTPKPKIDTSPAAVEAALRKFNFG